MKNKRLIGIIAAITLLLLIPFLAMQFSTEVNWSASDFMIVGFLLLATGLSCELVLRKIKNKKQRIGLCLMIIAGLLLVWVEMAVGVFGTPLAGS
ncbi:hypothetical protein [Fulvivirga lutea]|uniref:Uncharacterized protein n=1 Tax=Fulvivirga lutea TaxID=2810512 RepID=A0A975A235_9BACT|nr:hypothetical protein [Fulvivirga lutea]QSE98456.1 hypothetical protein JR347_05095 [Fulvivirga lutea]